MTKREEAAVLLRLGLSPPEISTLQDVTLGTILGYLDAMIGRGSIRRSDVFFSMPRDQRTAVAAADDVDPSRTPEEVAKRMRAEGLDATRGDVEIVRRYGAAHHALGDFYEDIRAIEVGLHSLIERALRVKYGDELDSWFRQGVPEPVREKCGRRWAVETSTPVPHPYCFTDLIDLRAILNKRWTTVAPHLPSRLAADKPALLHSLVRLNELRKAVMHPVRGQVPSKADFDFLWHLRQSLGFTDPPVTEAIPTETLEGWRERLDLLPHEARARLQEGL